MGDSFDVYDDRSTDAESGSEERYTSAQPSCSSNYRSSWRWVDLEDSDSEDSNKQKAVSGASSSSLSNMESPSSSERGPATPWRPELSALYRGRSATSVFNEREEAASTWGEPKRRFDKYKQPETRTEQVQRNAKGSWKGSGADKGSGKGWKGSSGKGAGKSWHHNVETYSKGSGKGSGAKLQCQFIIGIEEDAQFRVVKRIIGLGGENMKMIAENTGVKLRLRGRGSKFLEGPMQRESSDPLMLCISGQSTTGFEQAKRLASELLDGIHDSYRSFCMEMGKRAPKLVIRINEGYREGSR